jgi:hypothetical protein
MPAGKVEPGAAISYGKAVLVGPKGTGHALNAVQEGCEALLVRPRHQRMQAGVMAATLFAACRTSRVGEIQSSTQPVGVVAKTG